MEMDSMLSISRLDDVFNPILASGHKLWADFIVAMVAHGRVRLTGPKTAAEVAALSGEDKEKATKKAIDVLQKRIGCIVKTRHDWIHNCGRPKTVIQKCSYGEACCRVRDVKLFVVTLDNFIETHRLA
mgnify:FL=1